MGERTARRWRTSNNFGEEEEVDSLVNGTRAVLVGVEVCPRLVRSGVHSRLDTWRARLYKLRQVIVGFRLFSVVVTSMAAG